MKTSPKFFLCYSREDSEFTIKLAQDLKDCGVDLWMDSLSIPAGSNWDEEVEKALDASDSLIVVLSPGFVASSNARDEWSFALEENKTIVPVVYKQCKVPFRLRRKHYIDFTQDYRIAFKQLSEELQKEFSFDLELDSVAIEKVQSNDYSGSTAVESSRDRGQPGMTIMPAPELENPEEYFRQKNEKPFNRLRGEENFVRSRPGPGIPAGGGAENGSEPWLESIPDQASGPGIDKNPVEDISPGKSEAHVEAVDEGDVTEGSEAGGDAAIDGGSSVDSPSNLARRLRSRSRKNLAQGKHGPPNALSSAFSIVGSIMIMGGLFFAFLLISQPDEPVRGPNWQFPGSGSGMPVFQLSTFQLELLPTALERSIEELAETVQEESELNALLDSSAIARFRILLRKVENIPYPNQRLLDAAIRNALVDISPESPSASDILTPGQFDVLVDSLHRLPGIEGSYSPRQEGMPPEMFGQGTWRFMGCACEVSQENQIYGFYMPWQIPTAGMAPQQIDFSYYERIAYFGGELDSQGGISNDEFWREGGALNTFIRNAHSRNTLVDLAIFAPQWHLWTDVHLNLLISNIIDRLSIPTYLPLLTSFASDYLTPIYPTRSELIRSETMGDGLTIYFENLVDLQTGEVRELNRIAQTISMLSSELERRFPDRYIPVNLMLDIPKDHTSEILIQLRPLIIGTAANQSEYTERVLIFLEQDNFDSGQNLVNAVREVFRDDGSSFVLGKINPILIPARTEQGDFRSLTRDLVDFRSTFGQSGGTALWPIPIAETEDSLLIERAVSNALDDSNSGFWNNFRRAVRIVYFPQREEIIFSLTSLYSVSILILMFSIKEPLAAFPLAFARVAAMGTFTFFVLSFVFIDPYLSPWRLAFFVLPTLIVLTLVPVGNQFAMPSEFPVDRTNLSNASTRSAAIRKLRRKLRNKE